MVNARLGRRVLLAALAICALVPSSAAAFGARPFLESAPLGDVAARDATFNFRVWGTPTLAHFECRLDGGRWARCSSPVRYTGLIGGPHSFEVRLVGLFDNAHPVRRDWIVTVGTESLACAPAVSWCSNPLKPGRKPAKRRARRRDADGCAYAANRPGEFALATLERALVCLFSNLRRARGQRALEPSEALARAAARHSLDMVARRYFAHESLAGASPADRIRGAGYMRGTHYWAIGEILAWNARPVSPKRIVEAWLNSPPHRAVIFTPEFRHVGVALRRGTPRGGSGGGITAVGEFGRRG